MPSPLEYNNLSESDTSLLSHQSIKYNRRVRLSTPENFFEEIQVEGLPSGSFFVVDTRFISAHSYPLFPMVLRFNALRGSLALHTLSRVRSMTIIQNTRLSWSFLPSRIRRVLYQVYVMFRTFFSQTPGSNTVVYIMELLKSLTNALRKSTYYTAWQLRSSHCHWNRETEEEK